VKDFPTELQLLYRTLDSFHKTNEDKQDIHLLDLANLFFSNRPNDKEYYETLFENIVAYSPKEETVLSLIVSLQRARLLRELSIKSYEVAEGKKPFDDVSELLAQLNKLEEKQSVTDEDVFVSSDLEELASDVIDSPGLHWRLKALNRSLGPLRKGDFGFVFARPETGKTTFLASEVSFMAEQTDRPILWFNNEEQGEKVMMRVYQASLGLEQIPLLANKKASTEAFLKKTNNNIKMRDSATIHFREIETLCEQLQPALIVIDQLPKVKGFKADREDLMLGHIFIWGRELAKKYAPVIGVSQADGTAENVKHLTMQHVANAKTSVQAEADWILGLGKTHDTGWEEVRFLNISKNKLMGDKDTDPKMRHSKMEVLINPYIARYVDMK